MRTESFEFGGYTAEVIIPDRPNGKWIWKTEFFYAFDSAERALLDMGYTRVYYQISNMYGSVRAVRLMHRFRAYVTERYSLCPEAILFGFSRGGLYAFNYALYHPEYVDRVYLDAPVLDLKSWPREGSAEWEQMLAEYCLCRDTLPAFSENPADNLREYLSLGIPTLLVAGDADEIVPFEENSARLIECAEGVGANLTYYIKSGCKHHPHSLEDVQPIIDFVTE